MCVTGVWNIWEKGWGKGSGMEKDYRKTHKLHQDSSVPYGKFLTSLSTDRTFQLHHFLPLSFWYSFSVLCNTQRPCRPSGKTVQTQ
uniref:Uncharacterized protein n=1 Tax=Anguilla anguilla TaxID=7936 RepID=A0A0E9WHT6_ANGAN